jgi:acetolactate synthase I/II/III large subunit
VTQAEDVAPWCARRSTSRARAGRARCSSTSRRTRSSRRAEFDWDPTAPKLRGYRPDRTEQDREAEQRAADADRTAERPVILAGPRHHAVGAMEWCGEFAERTDIPVAMTLLGIGACRRATRSTSA